MSGVWRTVAFSRGCAVIFHSPLGCVHVASDMDLGSQFRIISEGQREITNAVPLISSNIREKDTIFGGVSRLKQCIEYVMKNYKPECLFIASSCVAGVIGDDVECEAHEAEKVYGIPVICLPYAGFLGGEYGDGYFKTAHIIVDRFFTKKEHIRGKVLLLGDQMGPSGQYALEVKRILSMFGLHAEEQFPGYASFVEWKNLTSAEWTVILGIKGQSERLYSLADTISSRYGVKLLTEQYPTGWENTKCWIQDIGKRLNKTDLADHIILEEENRLNAYVKTIYHITENKKAVIGIGRDSKWYSPIDTIRSIDRLGMKLEGIIFYDNLPDKERAIYTEQIKTCTRSPVYHGGDHQELINRADIFLTTNEILNTKTKQFFLPMMPMAGTNGEIFILRALYRLLCRYGNKGGIAYATV